MIYKFAQVYYLFVVKKVNIIEATGYRKAARLLKVVFKASVATIRATHSAVTRSATHSTSTKSSQTDAGTR